MRKVAPRTFLSAILLVSAMVAAAAPAHADLGDCGQPLSTGADPVATDCLFILRAAVSLETCSPECICDPTGTGGVVASSDALACLQSVVGSTGLLNCSCDGTTTTTLGGTSTTTVTSTSSTTSTTLPTSTTTTTTGPTTTTSSTTSTTLTACGLGGVELEESCWFVADTNVVSCDTVCAGVERTCDEAATRDVAGSGGTLANCVSLVTFLIGTPDQNYDANNDICGGPDLGIGCAWFEENDFPPPQRTAFRVTSPVTTCAADGDNENCTSGGRRICACVD